MSSEMVSLEDVVARFGLIDAEFVSSDCLPGAEVGKYVVRFYPYWEHPTYLEAMELGRTWAVPGRDEGAELVTVHAYGVEEVLLRRRSRVLEWSHPKSHPALHRFENRGEIICESELHPRELLRRLRLRLRDEFDDDLLVAACGYGRDLTEPVCLGEFPRSLYLPIREELEALGVELRETAEPSSSSIPPLLLLDGRDYIIAERFEVEVPEFRFHPAWVTMG